MQPCSEVGLSGSDWIKRVLTSSMAQSIDEFIIFVFETGSHYVAQASFKLLILLLQPLSYVIIGVHHHA
jgi:hypothetical protein